jgi:dihydropteroate synthase
LAQGADVLAETQQFFEEALCSAQADGLSREAVVLGLRLHNEEPVFAAASLHLVAQMGCFHRWERPLLLTDVPAATRAPAATLNADATERQTAAMVARMVHGMLEGVQIFHGGNVEAVAATVRTISAVLS